MKKILIYKELGPNPVNSEDLSCETIALSLQWSRDYQRISWKRLCEEAFKVKHQTITIDWKI